MTKPLIPSMRERNRYLIFELISESKFNRDDVVRHLWSALLRSFGEFGAGETGFWVLEWEHEAQKGILKVNHKSVDRVRAALTLMKEINNEKVIFHALGISGTIKKAREKYLRDDIKKK